MRNQLFISLLLAPLPVNSVTAKTDAVEATLQTALERLQSGVTLTERSSDGTFEINAVPVRTWKSVTGHYCRAYEVRVTENAGRPPLFQTGTRCRGADGVWREVEDQ